jgi:hypothetical protein
MTDLKWFLLCVFGFLLVISGLSLWFVSYSGAVSHYLYCKINCPSCISCSGIYSQARAQGISGVALMILGTIITLCSCPIVTRRLKSRTNLTGTPTQANNESVNLREQINMQRAQLQSITERLAQMEKGQETETRPLGSEVVNNH